MKNQNFGLHEKVATIIAQIACHENQLPQGSPCSPIISNLIAHLLDVRLAQLAKKNGCTYSRYADDITFSTNQKKVPAQITFQNLDDSRVWHIGRSLEKQINKIGFKVNHNKTRMFYSNSRQTVTGLVTNKEVNVRTEYYKLARAMANSFFTKGYYYVPGKLSPCDITEKNACHPLEVKSISKLEGILSHIYFTKKFIAPNTFIKVKDIPCGIKKIFKTLLFLKYFVANTKPIVLCEGKTDIIYIKLAIKKIIEEYPLLANKEDEKLNYHISFLKTDSKNIDEVLELGGGADKFKHLINTYKAMINKCPAWSPKNPVIILVDNDKKGEVLQLAKTKKESPNNTSSNFIYVMHNLYVLQLPSSTAEGDTSIEDLFPQKWLDSTLDGKEFGNNTNGRSDYYGKVPFAKKVIMQNFSSVDFSNFKPLLNNLVKVIESFNKLQAGHTNLKKTDS